MLVCYLVVVVKLCCEKYKPLFVFFVFIPGCLPQYDVSAFEILPTIDDYGKDGVMGHLTKMHCVWWSNFYRITVDSIIERNASWSNAPDAIFSGIVYWYDLLNSIDLVGMKISSSPIASVWFRDHHNLSKFDQKWMVNAEFDTEFEDHAA